ncbi:MULTISPECIES: shikimate kinase AroK [unclassified Wenzhouxiangella]|uniref:shikimate kinase AroK n=1 Tax=unclassified Wenzhouxiangella TaxID=2613841 RepID=UPI000E325917|nr:MULTISPECIES: shikimate kinase AroK [unclassified Wenzhouxiangella]RFF26941.1 shikimate kinase AroK [Wenzhouxiangella sp. 15181]RFP69454.1 shikimate kinase AroK [Wenzhouxiangella sp. 15190]
MTDKAAQGTPDRIFLVGPMGSGKTTVGRRLARRLGMAFVDLDLELQARCGVEVAVIFDIEGESGFRERESALLDELSRRDGLVLATGGGSVLNEDNRQMLTERGLVVYLKTSVDQQLRRLERDKQRPLLQAPDRRRRLTELAEQRNPVYESCADLIIRSADISPAAMAADVARRVQDHHRRARAS